MATSQPLIRNLIVKIPDCKPAASRLQWFESTPAHHS